MPAENPPAQRERTPEQLFIDRVEHIAAKELTRLFDTKEGKQAVAAVALAFRAAVQQAEKPEYLLACSMDSIRNCMVNCARYQMMPSGAYPSVYLVPKAGQLGLWMNHRGLCDLAERSGYHVECRAHFTFDKFNIQFGLNPDLTHVPGVGEQTYENLVGVYVIVWKYVDGRKTFVDMLDMPKSEIQKRRNCAQTPKVWNAWPIPQAMKTAIKFAFARGMVVLNSEAREALSIDEESHDYVDGKAESLGTTPRPTAKAQLDKALGLDPDPIDYSEATRQSEREPVTVRTEEPAAKAATAPEFARFASAVSADLGLDVDAMVEWHLADYGTDPRTFAEPDLVALYNALMPGKDKRKAFEGSPFYVEVK